MKRGLTNASKQMARGLVEICREQAASIILVSFQSEVCVNPGALGGLPKSALWELAQSGLIQIEDGDPVKVTLLPDLGLGVAQDFKGLMAFGVEAGAAQSPKPFDATKPAHHKGRIIKTIWGILDIVKNIGINLAAEVLKKLLLP